jgi:hypothetical protein
LSSKSGNISSSGFAFLELVRNKTFLPRRTHG